MSILKIILKIPKLTQNKYTICTRTIKNYKIFHKINVVRLAELTSMRCRYYMYNYKNIMIINYEKYIKTFLVYNILYFISLSL